MRSRPPSRAATSARSCSNWPIWLDSGSASTPAAILASLAERERLGSTGFGQGVALPHGKIEGLTRIYGMFVRLGEPVDFKALDKVPVDLVFLLLSPPEAGAEHLKALAAISRVTRHAPTLEKMRGARSRDALAAVLLGADEREVA